MLNLSSIFTAIDGTPQVSIVSMICMVTTLALAVVPSIYAIWFAKKKYQGSLLSLIYGLALYGVFDFLVLTIVINAWNSTEMFSDSPALLSVLEAIIKGSGRVFIKVILIFAIAKSNIIRNANNIGNTIIAGTGYMLSSAATVLIIWIPRVVTALSLNLYGVGNITADMDAETLNGFSELYENLMLTSPHVFLCDGIEYLLRLGVSISVAVVVYAVHNKKAHRSLLIFTLAVNFLFELPFCFKYHEVLFKGYLSMLAVASLFALWLVLLAYKTKNVSLKEEVKARETEIKNAKKQAFPDFNANIKK